MPLIAWLGFAGTALLWPATAHAAAGALAGTALGGGAFVLILAAGAALFMRERRRMRALAAERDGVVAAAAELDGVLEVLPLGLCRWRDGEPEGRFVAGALGPLHDCAVRSFADLLALLEAKVRAELETAVARLRADGTAFRQSVSFADGRTELEAVGRRAAGSTVVAFLDQSSRRAAAAECAALAEQRARLRALLDALPLPVWRRDADLNLVDCNRAYAAAVDAPVAATLSEAREIAAGVIGENGRALAGRARSSAVAQSESHHIVVAGSRRLMEFTEAPLDGGLVGYAQDFTDLENIQAELARHIAAHADVLENVAVAIAIYGPDTRLTFHNTAFANLWRLEEDWLGTEPTLDEVLERLRERRRIPEHADFRAFKRQQLAMFTSLIEPQEELLHLPDERTLRLVVSPHPFGGLTFVYEEVTDKLALERSYNTMIEVQRETLDNLYEAVAVFGSDGRLKLSNPAYAQMWQLDPADLQGEPHVSEIIEKQRPFYDDGGDWAAMKRRIIARLTAHMAESTRLARRDGSILQAVTVPLPDGNVLLSYLDVTDSTRVEHALRERNEALETAGRLKSEFIANVSYELRTPLNAIIGFAEILTNQYFGELTPRQLDYSRGILDSSHRLLSLINDILDLATIEAGYMTLETQDVDIHTLMSSVLSLTRERARKQNLKLEFDCPTDIGALVADERRLKQALFNLISNALKFTPPGGTVTLAARRTADRVALIVADTGVGVPREDQARIFEKFERGSPNARQSGPGLGLSLVKSFIELHGGTVEMDSRPGSGTTVTCYLSLAPGAATAVPAEPAAQRSAGD
ncbi:MAG TPA: ATP-binding protein [Stellaceae bacterium]|nr:ATP-binding protein [Stellaceae bacterium]